MKQIIHDCHAVPKALNALVVCSSNIYIAKVNYLPNCKTKQGEWYLNRKTEAEILSYGLHVPSVMYALGITQTSSNIKQLITHISKSGVIN